LIVESRPSQPPNAALYKNGSLSAISILPWCQKVATLIELSKWALSFELALIPIFRLQKRSARTVVQPGFDTSHSILRTIFNIK
jgi:hypothetical protein